jgi:hypothetical protein
MPDPSRIFAGTGMYPGALGAERASKVAPFVARVRVVAGCPIPHQSFTGTGMYPGALGAERASKVAPFVARVRVVAGCPIPHQLKYSSAPQASMKALADIVGVMERPRGHQPIQ